MTQEASTPKPSLGDCLEGWIKEHYPDWEIFHTKYETYLQHKQGFETLPDEVPGVRSPHWRVDHTTIFMCCNNNGPLLRDVDINIASPDFFEILAKELEFYGNPSIWKTVEERFDAERK